MRIYITTQPRAGTHWLCSLIKDILGYPNFHNATEQINWTEQAIQDKVEKLVDGEFYIFHMVDPATIIKYITPATDYVFSITRDLKDILVSRYLLYKYSGAPKIHDWNTSKGSLSDRDFINEFVRNPPQDHVKTFEIEMWKMYNKGYIHPNYMLVTYEDLTNDILNQLKNICTFLNISKNDTELNKIITDNSFETITGRTADESKPEYFIRKGIVGDYLNYLDQDVIDFIDANIQQE